MAGIYVHIPFCKRKCIYCDFYSLACSAVVIDRYVAAVLREATLRRGELKGEVHTLYVGGGTPSLLNKEQFSALIKGLSSIFDLSALQEFTIEVNPDDVTAELISIYKAAGVNRVSMGVQSFDDLDLRFINRRHTAQQALDAVKVMRQSGIQNTSIDLIYGIPGQTLDIWWRNVDKVASLGVQHISAYCLSYEEGTPLWHMRERGEVQEVDEDLSVKMFEILIDGLREACYEHYEISNFALPGYESKHNSSYWNGTPYLGLGAAAHSYDGVAERSYNPADLQRYMSCLESGQLPCTRERLSQAERYDEMVMLALRTARGLDATQLELHFGQAAAESFRARARRFLDAGMLQCEGGIYRLTRKGVMVSNMIIADLFSDP